MPGIGIGISPCLKGQSVPLNPLNNGLLSAYYFNQNTLATKGLQDGEGVDITYSADTEGYKAVFNGTTSRIYADISSDFRWTGDFTLNVDFTLNAINVNQYFIGQCNTLGSDATISFLGNITALNKVNYTFNIGGTFYTATSSSSVTTGVKYITLLQRVGNVYKLYVNNVLEATLTQSGAINESNYKVCFGGAGEIIGALLSTISISLVRTWNRELTTDEKTELYDSGNGTKFYVPSSTWGSSDVTTQIIDANSTGYSTFQSNSQRNVYTSNGLFAVWVHSTSGGSYLNQTWYLKKSTNNGRTWTTVYSNTCYDQVPTLETDSNGNLYLMYIPVSGAGAVARWLKFSNTDYTTPSITTNLTISYSSKMCTCIDETNNKFYFFIGLGYYAVLNLSGTIVINVTQMWQNTAGLTTEYPSATIDNSGNIYSAWTTQVLTPPTPIYYYDIRWIVSRDFGATWQMADGTPLTLPLNSGLGESVTSVGDLIEQNWLGGFTFVNGRLHALYTNYSNGVTYVTINPTTAVKTNKTAIINAGTFNIDGFFSRKSSGTLVTPTSLYLVTSDNRTQIKCFKSIDNGATWTAWQSRSLPQLKWTYSICGYREQVNNTVIGVYTLLTARAISYTENDGAYTYFTKINI